MISRIMIEGLGPHTSTDLRFDALGTSTVKGASEAGKSTLMDAVCFALWGQDRSGRPLHLAEMRHDVNACRVELVLSNGATCERVLHRDKDGNRGKSSRTWQGQPYKTERDFLTALGPLGRNVPALRLVLLPFAWRAMVEGEGKGRKLRDVLASILPDADIAGIVETLMREDGQRLLDSDTLHETDAKELRTRVKRTRDKQHGDVSRLEQLVEAARAADAVQGDTLTRYAFQSWSDAGARSHSVILDATPDTFVANLQTEHRVRATSEITGIVIPSQVLDVNGIRWMSPTDSIQLIGQPTAGGFVFAQWSGDTTFTGDTLVLHMSRPWTVRA